MRPPRWFVRFYDGAPTTFCSVWGPIIKYNATQYDERGRTYLCIRGSDFADEFARDLANYEVVTPAKVDQSGAHLSHHVTHHLRPHNKHRQRRSAAFWEEEGGDHGENDSRLHYKVTVDGEELHLELTPNDYLFAPGLVVERRRRSTTRRGTAPSHGDARVERIAHNKCHFAGKVKGRPESTVAIATCDGLVSKISLFSGFIRDVEWSCML